MKAYKEELDRLRTMIELMSKSFIFCTQYVKSKSSFNTIGHVSQGVYILDSTVD